MREREVCGKEACERDGEVLRLGKVAERPGGVGERVRLVRRLERLLKACFRDVSGACFFF